MFLPERTIAVGPLRLHLAGDERGNADGSAAFDDLAFFLIGKADSGGDLVFADQRRVVHQRPDHLERVAVVHPDAAAE